ncbi:MULTISPECIES: MFS transporter [unclassified Siphonobacter]|uniref:MFS transporter n=1 Tax=unclassified Siphonobacter TaxID=2635712 RepID=UPI000CC71426|nr:MULTISPECIES: MFS transporter [unclassified Siphonobacter]MDQ1089594.1 MFS family permease [Siphonobacter sp. SORGH_AS_1065]PKK37399.1 MFS transporter [Siphonobacter sp. SORGH_AS_0500]
MKTPPTDPFAALRYKEFTFYGLGSFFFTTAILIQEVVLGYQIYRITHDPLALGLVGLAEAIPYISLALLGGHLADKYDKKTIILLSLSVILAGSFILHWATLPETRAIHDDRFLLMIIYSVVALIGFARGFYSPATASLKAFLTPREVYANAASWYSSFWQTGAILGPGIAGFLYSWMGMSGTMWLVIGSIGVVFILFSFIKKKPIPEPTHEETSVWQSIREGIGFVFKSKILLYSISLDLVAVLFGGVVAILPVFAEDVLKVGAEGLGILRAAPSVGAVLTIIGTAVYSPVKKAWLNMLIAVAGFGLTTIIFALSTHFWLSVLMLFLTGAFDSISVVIRQAILQLVPPDEIRGRVLSVNSIFVSTSNEIGAFESGLLAKAFGTVPSVLIGGSLTIVIVGLIWVKTKELLHVKLI